MSPEEVAATEEGEGRDGLHIVLGGRLLVLIHIHLDDADAVTKLLLQVLQYGVHGLAGAAPSGKEIDEHKAVGGNDIVEGFHRALCLRS